jgi:hypothetical protein
MGVTTQIILGFRVESSLIGKLQTNHISKLYPILTNRLTHPCASTCWSITRPECNTFYAMVYEMKTSYNSNEKDMSYIHRVLMFLVFCFF